MSKSEAMQEIKPVVKTKKATQKRGAVVKKKLSLKKKMKKTKAKSAVKSKHEKDAKAMLQKDELEQASEKAPIADITTAEKVSEAAKPSAKGRGRAAGKGRGKGRGKGAATASAEASAEASEGHSEEKISALLPAGIKKEPVQVRAVSEEGGKVYFGFEGEVEKQEFETKGKEDFIHVYGSKVLSVKVQWLQKIDATWSKPT
jgi:hypothetical protein